MHAKSVISSGNTGDISLDNVIAAEKLSIERSTGDVKFKGSDAAELFVKTDTGDVTGSLLTSKDIYYSNQYGDVVCPTQQPAADVRFAPIQEILK